MVLEEFERVAEFALSELHLAIRNEDMQTVASQAHSLKGAAANIGAESLATVSGDMEKAARENNSLNTEEKLVELTKTINSLRECFPGVLSELREAA